MSNKNLIVNTPEPKPGILEPQICLLLLWEW